MKHINTKIATLLHEGFSISTLDSLNENQINLLYEKAKKVKKEPKEVIMTSDQSKAVELSKQGATVKLTPPGAETTEGSKNFIQKATKKMESKGTEGKFGRWCKKEGLDSDGEVTKKCISVAMKSDDPAVVKMANFAKNIGGFKGSEPKKKKTETKEVVKNLEESIMKLIEDHLPPHTTKGELLYAIRRNKR
jgi:hypothetical protein